MLIIGERINATRKHVGEAVTRRNKNFIIEEVNAQVNAGANMIDVNAGKSPEKEIEDMKWLMDVIQSVTTLPLCLDSANPEVLEAALNLNKNGKPMVNSIADESNRIKGILPLIKKYDCMIVALLIDEKGVPDSVERRLQIADSLVNKLLENNIRLENVYVDPCVFPLSTNSLNALNAIESIKKVKDKFSGIKTAIGLSNISYGLPLRSLINQTFMVLCINAGLDAALIDPLDKKMLSIIYATNALLNKDEYCMEYITAARENKLV